MIIAPSEVDGEAPVAGDLRGRNGNLSTGLDYSGNGCFKVFY
jgi:hypothetical protein